MTTMTKPPVEQEPTAPVPAKQSRLQSLMKFEITAKKVKRKDLMHFSRQLAVFLEAGVPITDALSAIEEEAANKFFAAILADVREALAQGATFTNALQQHEDAFPPYYLGIIRSAELTGQLDVVLTQLADYLERDIEARGKITAALVYPSVVIVMAIAVVIILTSFVLPRFEKFFGSLHAKLPLPTRMLLSVTHFLTNWWWLIIAVIVLVVVAALAAARTERGKMGRDRLLLGLPGIGGVVRYAILERFCRILGAMTRAGVPLPEALAVSSSAANNRVYRAGLDGAREAMLRGEGLAAPMAASGLFPAAARQMMRVGEETGTLDRQLETAAKYFDRELDYKLKKFTSLFEPVVLIFVGVIVGFVAIALVSAMYGIYNQVKV
jgi:type IV pilus assembly protein PilC